MSWRAPAAITIVSAAANQLSSKICPSDWAYAARKIPYVHLVTNGLTTNPQRATQLASTGIQEISVSIDGSAPYHDWMRGIDGAFKKTWAALEAFALHADDVNIVVNSVVTPYNIQGLRELRDMLDQLPGIYYKYLPLSFSFEFYDW